MSWLSDGALEIKLGRKTSQLPEVVSIGRIGSSKLESCITASEKPDLGLQWQAIFIVDSDVELLNC
jgi:hypothetical protein